MLSRCRILQLFFVMSMILAVIPSVSVATQLLPAQSGFAHSTVVKNPAWQPGDALQDVINAERVIGPYATGQGRNLLINAVLSMHINLQRRLTSKTRVILLEDYGSYTRTFSNVPGLDKAWARFRHLQGNMFQAPDGSIQFEPAPLPPPNGNRTNHLSRFSLMQPLNYVIGQYPGSGPYRRVYTRNDTGFNAEFASASLPCSYSFQSYEGGQVYEGGWSGQGAAIDAGLQINNNSIAAYPFNPYQPYAHIRIPPIDNYYGVSPSKSTPPDGTLHWKCGLTLGLEFSVGFCKLCGDNQQHAWFVLHTTDTAGHDLVVDIVMCGQPYPYFGWSYDCPGCILKRALGIGQTGTEDLYNHSYFGTTPPATLSDPVVWSGSQLQAVGTTYWQPWTANLNGGCDEYYGWFGTSETDCGFDGPPPGYLNKQVAVHWVSYAAENDAIINDPTNPITGSTQDRKWMEICRSPDPPYSPYPAYFDTPNSPPSFVDYVTPTTTQAPVSMAKAVMLGISTRLGPAQITLFSPTGKQLNAVVVAANVSGELAYFSSTASPGAYKFEVTGLYETADPGCNVPKLWGTDPGTSWEGDLLWH